MFAVSCCCAKYFEIFETFPSDQIFHDSEVFTAEFLNDDEVKRTDERFWREESVLFSLCGFLEFWEKRATFQRSDCRFPSK